MIRRILLHGGNTMIKWNSNLPPEASLNPHCFCYCRQPVDNTIIAYSVEYGSVVQMQRRGDDAKHEAVVEAVGNECNLALLRVDLLFPSPGNDRRLSPLSSSSTTYPLPLGRGRSAHISRGGGFPLHDQRCRVLRGDAGVRPGRHNGRRAFAGGRERRRSGLQFSTENGKPSPRGGEGAHRDRKSSDANRSWEGSKVRWQGPTYQKDQ